MDEKIKEGLRFTAMNNEAFGKELIGKWEMHKKGITLEEAVECQIRAIDELNGQNMGLLHQYLQKINRDA